MNKLTVKDVEVCAKRVLVRCDFNVPIKDGQITDDNRIVQALPTIKYLMSKGAKVVLCSHLGRPKGEFNKKYTLAPVAERLSSLLGQTVFFANDVVGEDARTKVAALKNGEVALLENLRFHAEEEANDKDFCQKLANFCDIFVSDAFGTAHRAHASTAGIVQYGFVKTAVSGFLIEKEIEFLASALEQPARPFVAILGGAKVSDKIGVIENLLGQVDALIVGGGMAFTFLAAAGHKIGSSMCEAEKLELAARIMEKAKQKGVELLLPVDVRAAAAFPSPIDAKVDFSIQPSSNIPDGLMGLDIGPRTQELFAQAVSGAKTVVWNGPMGVFENQAFAAGTYAVADAIAKSSAISIIGGGDSAAAVISMGLSDKISHISTGGGASLEMLEGKPLPGITCLNEKQ